MLNRRKLLLGTLFGTGYVGLRALATGLPVSWMQGSRVAHAAPEEPPQFLILATSGAGDPLNVNCPGSYVTGAQNSPHPELAPVDLKLGSVATRAAKPWAALAEDLRARLCFIHHRTYSNAHPEYRKVMSLAGDIKLPSGNGEEMLPSLFAAENAQALATLQVEPIALGQEQIVFQSRPLDRIDPVSIKSLFDQPDDLGLELQKLRDAELDAIYGELRTSGTRAQKTFLDRYALGRDQVRKLGDTLIGLLGRVPLDPGVPNSPADQVIAAVALIKMRVAPVITISVPFGGDNHGDADLTQERDQTLVGILAIGQLWQELKDAALTENVTFAILNAFGRTLKRNAAGGRNHNGNHHVMLTFGKRIKPGVIGQPAAQGNDFAAGALDSHAGQTTNAGDIPATETLESVGKTLGAALGLDRSALEARIPSGKVLEGALT
jgi:uncharacterized protein (DUF1501 family)